MTIQEERDQAELDPAAADEVVSRDRPVIDDVAPAVVAPAASPGRVSRGASAARRALLTFVLFALGAAAGFGAGWGYGPGLVEGENRTDLVPSYAEWPWFWWALLATIPVALGLAFSRRLRPAAFGFILALPWQLVLSFGYALVTFGTWGFAPLP